MTEDIRSCADSIKLLRKSLRMNTTEFAAALDVCAPTIASWETGRRWPSHGSMKRMLALSQKNRVGLKWEDFFQGRI
jgi:DNA-binding transcriptional regulator YiaG